MRNTFIIFIITFFTYSSSFGQEKLTSFVDPFMGTGGEGKTSPGVVVPYGMVQLTPDNGRNRLKGTGVYRYSDNKIAGFSHVHLNGGSFGDWLDISVMPLVSPLKGQDTIFKAATFSHQRESAVPGYYSVELDNKIRVELTTSDRVSYQRFTFPAGSEPTIRFDLAAQQGHNVAQETFIQKENDSTLVGYRSSTGGTDDQKLYFAAKTSKPILEFRLKGEMDIEAGDINIGLKSDIGGEGVTSQLIFNPTNIPEIIELKVALSIISTEDALKTLAEVPQWNFNAVRSQANAKWEDELGKIRITSSDLKLKRVFYTALYHTAIAPQKASSDRVSKILPFVNFDSTEPVFPSMLETERLKQRPWEYQALARHLVDSMFQDGPDGYLGEAGVDQMSVWAVWNILGFYDANRPGGEYYITSPMIDRAIINVNNNNQFEIEVLNKSPQNKYVRSLKLNGANYKKDYLLHTDLIKGGKLTVNMGPEPNMKRSEDQENGSPSEKRGIFQSLSDFFNNLFK